MSKRKATRKDAAPRKRASRARRSDGWGSALTGIGQLGADKRLMAKFQSDVVNDQEALDLWRGNDLAARIVETPVNEMLRQGWDLSVKDNKDLADKVMAKGEELKISECLWKALCYRRAYGGGAILVGVDDGQKSMSKPVNLKRVKDIKFLTVLEPRELQPHKYYANPLAPKFGQPATYFLNPQTPGGAYEPTSVQANVEIHESRLIIFQGIEVSRSQTNANGGWGDNVFTRCAPILRDFGVAWDAACILLNDFSQAVYKVKGLAELMALDQDELFKTRVKAVEYSRSVAHAVFIDAEEEFERKTTQLTGFPEMLEKLATRLAASADQPVTLLMGISPAGLNATGESDVRFFYDRMKAGQDRDVRPPLEYFYKLLFLALNGGKEPEDWSIKFRPLWQPTEKEQAETKKIVMETDVGYINAQVASPEEIAKSRFGGDEYSTVTVLDWEAREALAIDAETHLEERIAPKPEPPPFGGEGDGEFPPKEGEEEDKEEVEE